MSHPPPPLAAVVSPALQQLRDRIRHAGELIPDRVLYQTLAAECQQICTIQDEAEQIRQLTVLFDAKIRPAAAAALAPANAAPMQIDAAGAQQQQAPPQHLQQQLHEYQQRHQQRLQPQQAAAQQQPVVVQVVQQQAAAQQQHQPAQQQQQQPPAAAADGSNNIRAPDAQYVDQLLPPQQQAPLAAASFAQMAAARQQQAAAAAYAALPAHVLQQQHNLPDPYAAAALSPFYHLVPSAEQVIRQQWLAPQPPAEIDGGMTYTLTIMTQQQLHVSLQGRQPGSRHEVAYHRDNEDRFTYLSGLTDMCRTPLLRLMAQSATTPAAVAKRYLAAAKKYQDALQKLRRAYDEMCEATIAAWRLLFG